MSKTALKLLAFVVRILVVPSAIINTFASAFFVSHQPQLLPILICLLILIFPFRFIKSIKKFNFYQPFEIPTAYFNLDQNAFSGRYRLDGSLGGIKPTPYIKVIRNVTGDDFIELFENGKKIFKADFNQKGTKSIITYDKSDNA